MRSSLISNYFQRNNLIKVFLRNFSSKKLYSGNGILGIVREDFSIWERRSPLCPHHVNQLTNQGIEK